MTEGALCKHSQIVEFLEFCDARSNLHAGKQRTLGLNSNVGQPVSRGALLVASMHSTLEVSHGSNDTRVPAIADSITSTLMLVSL